MIFILFCTLLGAGIVAMLMKFIGSAIVPTIPTTKPSVVVKRRKVVVKLSTPEAIA